MINDNLSVKGEVVITLTDENGNLKARQEINNLVVNTGKAFIASRMVGTASGCNVAHGVRFWHYCTSAN